MSEGQHVPWTIEEIETEWLGGSIKALAMPSNDVLTAFEAAERVLGRTWIENSRPHSEIILKGTSPTFRVAQMGRVLAALDGVAGEKEKLIKMIRGGDLPSEAEVTAIYLLRSRRPTAECELYPEAGARVADFRIRQSKAEPWTYVEVTQPAMSDAHGQAQTLAGRITALAEPIRKTFSLEVFLQRVPDENEMTQILETIPAFCGLDGTQEQNLPEGLGRLFLNQTPPGQAKFDDHGEEHQSRIFLMQAVGGSSEPHRHIVVRMAFADQRAEEIFKEEARQLPKDAPGLIMIQIDGATGGMKTWEPAIWRRFQPNIHRRVGAVCLFAGLQCPTPIGMRCVYEIKLFVNPHATLPIPAGILDALKEAGQDFEKLSSAKVAT